MTKDKEKNYTFLDTALPTDRNLQTFEGGKTLQWDKYDKIINK